MNFLYETIKLIDDNVKFNIQVMWGVLAFVVAAAGTALYYSARFWFQSAMDKKSKEIEQNILDLLTKKMYNISRTIAYGSCLIQQEIEPLGTFEFNSTTGGNPSRVKMYFGHRADRGIAYFQIAGNRSFSVYDIGSERKGLNFFHKKPIVPSYSDVGVFGKAIVLEKAELNGDQIKLVFRNTDEKNINTIDSEGAWEAEEIINWNK